VSRYLKTDVLDFRAGRSELVSIRRNTRFFLADRRFLLGTKSLSRVFLFVSAGVPRAHAERRERPKSAILSHYWTIQLLIEEIANPP
jgi:hypothetical protein